MIEPMTKERRAEMERYFEEGSSWYNFGRLRGAGRECLGIIDRLWEENKWLKAKKRENADAFLEANAELREVVNIALVFYNREGIIPPQTRKEMAALCRLGTEKGDDSDKAEA